MPIQSTPTVRTASPVVSTGAEFLGARRSLLDELRELATSPVLARTQGWDYLRELGAASNYAQLEALFARGYAPEGPDGAMEDLIVGPL